MALAQISDLWTPDIWIPGVREKMATFPSLLNSGIVAKASEAQKIATEGGVTANLPFFKDITDQADVIQVENTAATVLGITSGKQIVPILNRETPNSYTALSAQVSGSDPAGELMAQIAERKLKQRNATLFNLLRGAFRSAGAADASAPLSSVRLDSFDESGLDATSNQTFSPDLFIQACALMGELSDGLENGGLAVHPAVYASLQIADKESFKSGVESGLPFKITTYRGIPIFKSSLLYRAGTTDGYVYDSYIFAPGVVAWGEKPQVGGAINDPVLDVASLNIVVDAGKNNYTIYDRTRSVLHLNGMKWTGTPAGQSATNAELATYSNWDFVLSSQPRAGIVCIRTNA